MKKVCYNILYYIGKPILRLFFWVLFRYEVRGREHIPPTGGVIIAPNHLSYLDPPFVGIALPRKPMFIAKASLFGIPLLGSFVNLFSMPVDRDNPRPSTLKSAVRALREGYLVVIFPEGGRSPTGELMEAQRGAGLISAMASAPVVPALIEGTERAMPVGARFIRPVKLRITFGPPIYPSPEKDKKQIEQEITSSIMDKIRELKER